MRPYIKTQYTVTCSECNGTSMISIIFLVKKLRFCRSGPHPRIITLSENFDGRSSEETTRRTVYFE